VDECHERQFLDRFEILVAQVGTDHVRSLGRENTLEIPAE
jgi:hypothetical protein